MNTAWMQHGGGAGLGLLLLAAGLAGCDPANAPAPAVPPIGAVATSTAVPCMVPCPTWVPKATGGGPAVPATYPPPDTAAADAYATRLAERLVQVRTEVAAHPVPTLVIVPDPSPVPVHTPGLGVISTFTGLPFDPRQPYYTSGWITEVAGQRVKVLAGREGDQVDPMQGLILVVAGADLHQWAPTAQIYRTPRRVGTVRIVRVVGAQVQLALGDADAAGVQDTIQLVFDLVTRRWVQP
ncbi:MAG TPA: hypothetical protein VKY74_24095 [Chloroflexia bacterium]|nr:hypothetical protein [Chloroflexia bacterium]